MQFKYFLSNLWKINQCLQLFFGRGWGGGGNLHWKIKAVISQDFKKKKKNFTFWSVAKQNWKLFPYTNLAILQNSRSFTFQIYLNLCKIGWSNETIQTGQLTNLTNFNIIIKLENIGKKHKTCLKWNSCSSDWTADELCAYIQSWPKISAPLVNMIKKGCENVSAL